MGITEFSFLKVTVSSQHYFKRKVVTTFLSTDTIFYVDIET